jgi:acyl carrier protein
VVSSRYIALGYWREPDLTARAFASDPLDPLTRLYHTGDLVRRLPDGLVEFVGREDQQIKLHGHRIELNEIEAALKACTGVSAAAVLLRCNAMGSPLALVGYVQLRTGERGLLPRHLLAMLGQRVSAYMMPAEIVLMEELPWLPNFKIDRKRLAQIDATQSARRSSVEKSPLVVELIQIFERLTKASGATSSDNLLSMGGDSLQAVELALEIERRFQITLPEATHNSTRSIAEWASDIAAQRAPGAAGDAD